MVMVTTLIVGMKLNQIKMNRTIVFDLDDTICFCHNRDWENAKPNLDLIRRINKMYNDGWFIHIHSARGQLSGFDYYELVTKWLNDNGVLYHKLQFGKPLAMLYVDDKAISADDFMALEIEELPGGWSGSKVLRVGGKVFKDDPDIHNTVAWYNYADQFYNVPKVLSVTGKQLVLQYVKPNEKKPIALPDECRYLAATFEALPSLNKYKWKDYINRIAVHCDWLTENKGDEYHKILPLLANMKQPSNTFSHGDLTPDNTIIDRKHYVYLIDPINTTYSSWELDMAKIDAWELRNGNDDIVVNNLVVAETIRTMKYAPEEIYIKLRDRCLSFLRL